MTKKLGKTQKEAKKIDDPIQRFVKEYEVLCEKHGLQIVVNPAFKPRDDGTWSIVIQSNVGPLPSR